MTVSDASGTASTNYPLRFGRPFLKGAIPSGQCPVVVAAGASLPTQADVKNRYPDGSVEFAVIAAVLPNIPANGSVRLSFAPGACNNTPLSAAQMLDPAYNFDATMTLAGPPVQGQVNSGVWPSGNGTIPAMQAITNGGLKITINGRACDLEGLNFSADTNWAQVAATMTAPLSACSGATVTWVAVKPNVPNNGFAASIGTVGYASPPSSGTDLSAFMALTQAAGATLQSPAPASGGSASARTMLTNGDYKLWTSGPVAQTIILGDDTPSRKYDIGFGDGYHPFRPRFEATFWPATHQVFVRAIGENGLSTELEDLNYALTITGGQSSPATEEALPSLAQRAMATWTKSFWLGGAPNPQVNIDNNLAYLESTRFVPNYDPAVTISQAQIASDYAGWWANTSHDIGGAGAWTPGMPTTGARGDIGPEPSWDVAWLYTGDWRLRQTALGNADLAAWWPVNVRETDTTERLNVGDPTPVAPAVGTGYGHPISITDRVQLGPSAGGEGIFLSYNSGDPNPPNKLDVVGPLNTGSPNGWTFDVAHEPSPFFVPYILSGDPFYLEEMENWAAYDAPTNQGQYAHASSQGRGPTGAEGGLYFELRGDGWGFLHRAEAAFAEPDGSPEKTYLTTLTDSDIARWEGALGVADPVFSGSAEHAWAQQTGDPESGNTPNHAPPPLHNWEDGYSPNFDGGGQWLSTLTEQGYTNQWMQWYVQYSIGRIAELGFAAGPLTLYSGQYLTNEIDNSGYPQLVAAYIMPTNFQGSGQIASWPAMIADLSPAYLTGTGWSGSASQAPLPAFFDRQLVPQGYDMYANAALSPLVDEGAPGAAQAEAWVKANIYQPLIANGALAGDPSWAIVPRTDHNVLPPQPTALP